MNNVSLVDTAYQQQQSNEKLQYKSVQEPYLKQLQGYEIKFFDKQYYHINARKRLCVI